MKKLLLSATFIFGVMAAVAQTGGGTTPGNISAKSNRNYLSSVSTNDDIRQLANRMQLNEAQYIRLRDLTRAKNDQLREINNMYANDPNNRQQKMQAANQEFERQLAQSVSQSQFTAYLETQGRAPGNAMGNTLQATGYGGQSLEGGAATGTSVNGGAVNTNDNGSGNNTMVNAVSTNNKERRSDKNKKESRRSKMKTDKEDNKQQ